MADRLLRLRAIAAAIQPTAGTYVDPTLAGVMIVGNFTFKPVDATFVKRNIIRGFLGASGSLLTAKKSTAEIPMELTGSGTAGTPPQHGKLLRACALSETILAAAHTGTAPAGSTATTIKLAVAASAVNDAYQGMLIATTGGTGSGQERVIVDYDGASKTATVNEAWTVTPDATTVYNIAAQVAYNPVSANFEQVSIAFDDNGVLNKGRDARGTATIKLMSGEIPEISFSLLALIEGRLASALAGGTKPSIPAPAAALTANTSKLNVQGVQYPFKECTVTLGTEVAHALLIGQEKIVVKDRITVGKVSFDATAAQELNLLTAVENATLGPVWVTHGIAAGHRHVISLRNAQLTNPGEEEFEGQKLLTFDLEAQPSAAGNDDISYAQV